MICEPIKAYNSTHASLAALGRKVNQPIVFAPIVPKVQIAQKTVKYSPAEKLMDAFITLMVCSQGKIEINKQLMTVVSPDFNSH